MTMRPSDVPLPSPIRGMLPHEPQLSRVPNPPEQRIVAISRVLAAQARVSRGMPELGIRDVCAFRERYLPGGHLLDPEAVESWVAAQAVRDGAPDRLFLIAVHPEDIAREDGNADYLLGRDGGPLRASPLQLITRAHGPRQQPGWLYLPYASTQSPAAHVEVRVGGTLDALRRLAERLAQSTLWSPAHAATFALTGLIPYADRYASNLEFHRGRRARTMSVKHLELAVFTAEHEGETLAARLDRWNRAHSEWAYRTVEHFGGDSRLAMRRLVAEGASTDWRVRHQGTITERRRVDEDDDEGKGEGEAQATEEGVNPDADE